MQTGDKRPIHAFRAWEVDHARRELRVHGNAVPLGSRAFDIIATLILAEGNLVAKDDLMAGVWPGVIVTDNTLLVHISAIRKALGADRGLLKTEFNRGYRLLGDWKRREPDGAAPRIEPGPQSLEAVPSPQSNLPSLRGALIGRTASVHHVENLLSAYRVVTLTGPGGIGKTALALQASRRALSNFRDGVWLVELASLSDPQLVPPVVAGALGLGLNNNEVTAEAVARAIGDRTLLLVLDNCEHVVDAAAGLAETVMQRCPGTTILATSRELLRVGGEAVYRVPTLDVPPDHATPEDIPRHSAVQLFTARMLAQDADFSADNDNLRAIAGICRHLDGIPLAIELAAARATTLGVQYVAAAMDDRFGVLVGGRRTALPRQQTLRATLDWSYDLLTAAEQMVLRRLGAFASNFSMPAVDAVAAADDLSPSETLDCVTGLAAKSLVAIEYVGSAVSYRLLETTRIYALRKLEAAGETDACRRRHAAYLLGLLQDGAATHEADGSVRPSRQTRLLVDEVAAALDWAFSSRGDHGIGIALTIAAIPLWTRTSLLQECQRRVQQATQFLADTDSGGSRDEMQLLIASATAMQNSTGPGHDTTRLWRRANELAEQLGDQDYQLRVLWGLWIDCRNNGEHRQALQVANRFYQVATTRNTLDDVMVADRMVGMSQFILGDLENARRNVERMLAQYTETSLTSHMVRFHFEQRAGATFLLAMILCLQGFPLRARGMIDDGVTEVVETGHALQISVLLAQFACPVACLHGDLVRLEAFVSRLLDNAETHGLAAWSARGRCWQALLRIRQGETIAGIAALHDALQNHPGHGRAFQHAWFLGELAKAQADAGKHDEAGQAIDLALQRATTGGEEWCVPELMRIRGYIFQLKGLPTQAEAAYSCSLDLAQRQGARTWELRTATTLARFWCDQGRRAEAIALLTPIVASFDDGLETEDLRQARTVLNAAP